MITVQRMKERTGSRVLAVCMIALVMLFAALSITTPARSEGLYVKNNLSFNEGLVYVKVSNACTPNYELIADRPGKTVSHDFTICYVNFSTAYVRTMASNTALPRKPVCTLVEGGNSFTVNVSEPKKISSATGSSYYWQWDVTFSDSEIWNKHNLTQWMTLECR